MGTRHRQALKCHQETEGVVCFVSANGTQTGNLRFQAWHPGAYNYWHEWVTPDSNDDGIVDVPYIIEGVAENFDPFPRTFSSLEKFYRPIPPNLIFGIAFLLLIGISLRYISRKKQG